MGEIVVKHFKRSSASSEDKELVTEIVVQSSDTGRFLQRMEDSRLTRPCFQTIDMRGRVAGECRPYAFNDRVHYLDDISFQMFEQGLQANSGIYTVGTFEAIVGGAHTIQAQHNAREESERRREEIEQRRLHLARAAARERASLNGSEAGTSEADLSIALTDNPSLLPLGYFRKRTHPRLQYACPVVLESGNIKSHGITRDFSVCGAQVRIKGLTTFRRNQEVLVSYTGLQDEAGKVEVARVAYRITNSEERDAETVLCLRRSDLEKPRGFSAFIEDLVGRYQRKYKLDVDDEYQSVLSWYYERCYAQSAAQVPFFIEQNDSPEWRVQAVAMSEGNSHLARFFCTDADNYNFTPICLPHRLQHLAENNSFIMAMYRQRGERDQCMRIHSAADFEFSSAEVFQDFVRYTMAQSEHSIVKVYAGRIPLSSVSDKKLDEVSQRLQYKSESQMSELRERLNRLSFVGYIADMTKDFKGVFEPAGHHGELAAWVGSECRGVADGAVKEKLSIAAEHLRPELIRFGYVERRREDRYLAETKVDVQIGGKVCQGLSKDISTRGMRIQLDKDMGVKPGTSLKVGLVSLQKKKSATNLLDIPYRVVQSRKGEEGTVLMLERVLGGNREGLKEFFVELITKNQHKLGVDIGDIWGATASRVYEALLAANAPTVPFFLGRNNEGGAHLQFVGVPESGSALLDFFSSSEGVDFRCLNERHVVTALYDAVQILLRQSKGSADRPTPFELNMYLYKKYDELSGATFIHAATELDFSSDAAHEAFLEKLADQSDWRCIKIVSTFTQPLDEKALDKMIDSVRSQSKHRAIKLSDVAHSLVGYGELIDVTDVWPALREASAANV